MANILRVMAHLALDYHKQLGVTFDYNLNFYKHTSEVALKANYALDLACVKIAFVDLNYDVLMKLLYKALVRSIGALNFCWISKNWREYSYAVLHNQVNNFIK